MTKQKLTIEQALSKAKTAAQNGKLAQAEKLYKAILIHQPDNTDANAALKNLGDAFTAQNIEKLTKKIPDPEEYLATLSDYFDNDQIAQAENLSRELLKHHPSDLNILNYLGSSLVRQMRFQESVEFFEKALRVNPKVPEIHLNLASALEKLNRAEDCVKSSRKAIQLRPNFAEAHCVLGHGLQAMGNFKEAVKSYTKTLKLKPGYEDGYVGLGSTYLKQGKMRQGLDMKARAENVICLEPGKKVKVLDRL